MSPLVAAGTQFVPALLWAAIARAHARVLLARRPRGPLFWLLLALAALLALHYLLFAVVATIPGRLRGPENSLRGALALPIDLGAILSIACARHLVRVWPVRAVAPDRRWLLVNYGVAGVTAAVTAVADLTAGEPAQLLTPPFVVFTLLLLVALAVMVGELRRAASQGAWSRRGLAETLPMDRTFVGLGVLSLVASHLVPFARGTTGYRVIMGLDSSPAAGWMFALHAAGGLLLAVPFVMRDLGEIARSFLTGTTAIAATALVLAGVPALAARVADPELRRLLAGVAVVGLVAVLLLGRDALHAFVDGALLRVRRQRWDATQRFLHGLAPEVGVVECCARILAETARLFGLSGAAIVLHDGRHVAWGDLPVAPLLRVDAGARLPAVSIGVGGMRELPLPLKEALVEAGVVVSFPILSPSRRWGVLVVGPGPLGVTFGLCDFEAAETMMSQLARVLDAAELLARAVEVERSLAHAEKLAAIGELAARIAHEIRNPVTAARSLAQQLARAPATAADGETAGLAGLILGELERVERQVAALLRFARRDEFRFEPVDLADLVAATVHGLRPRLDAARVTLALDVVPGAVVRADREKIRQVLVNLLENALDALAERDGERRLAVGVRRASGGVALHVTDNGPGVTAEALPRLFEPFFSQKAHGTGLGLAIARRTVEAHGGRIAAAAGPGAGLVLAVDLPLLDDVR